MLSRLLAGKIEKRPGSRWYRPRIEALEERALLSANYWTGGGGFNTNWSNPANWSYGVPNPGDALYFAPTGGTVPNNDLPPGTIFRSLSFSGGMMAIQGNGIVLNGGGLTSNAGPVTINLSSITLSASQTFTGWLLIHSSINAGAFVLDLQPLFVPPNEYYGGKIYGTIFPGTISGSYWQVLGPIYLTNSAIISAFDFEGPASLNGFDLTVVQGSFDGGITGAGSLTFQGGPQSVLGVQLSSTISNPPVQVNGPIGLGGATLKPTLSFTPPSHTSFVIVQSSVSITGTFNGLPDGAALFINNEPFQIHYYNPGGGLPSQVVLSNDRQWRDVITGDFNGDGKSDIAGRNFAGQWWVGVSDGSSFTNQLWTTWNPNVTWVDVHVGDFNGDGKADIVGRVLQTGQWWVALSTGSSFVNSLWDTWSTIPTWVDVKVGDFTGDGKADIVGRYLEAGQWWLAQSTASSFTHSLWAMWSPYVTWVDVNVGDFDGDGKADITGRWLQAGQWWTGLSTGSSFDTTLWTTWNPNVTWVDVNVGDFNGDSKADITGRVLQTGQWWTAISTGSTFVNSLWTTWNASVTWVDVRVGDFDGGGKDEITGRVLETGQWWTAVSTGSSFANQLWTTWSPAVTWVDVQVGDFNGDGKAGLTGRWLQAGQWWTATSSGSNFSNSPWTIWPI
jgi:hypothetical protein